MISQLFYTIFVPWISGSNLTYKDCLAKAKAASFPVPCWDKKSKLEGSLKISLVNASALISGPASLSSGLSPVSVSALGESVAAREFMAGEAAEGVALNPESLSEAIEIKVFEVHLGLIRSLTDGSIFSSSEK